MFLELLFAPICWHLNDEPSSHANGSCTEAKEVSCALTTTKKTCFEIIKWRYILSLAK